MRATLALLSALALASAGPAPIYPGFKLLWSDGFEGQAGAPPNKDNWNFITNLRVNNEVQTYTTANTNLQLSGGNTVQLVPLKQNGEWTSARIESKHIFTPAPGKLTQFEATLRFGDHPTDRKQGIWPAFWLLGDSIHHGTEWPLCGELDIMETVNGLPTAHGTTHCGENQEAGGPCNEPLGRGATVALGGNGWHTWTLQVDRTNGEGGWRGEVIRWMVDGRVFHQLSGAEIGVEGVWATLAHSPMFMILNVAVGGNWPGPPNSATGDSWGSMMEVDYVGVYSS